MDDLVIKMKIAEGRRLSREGRRQDAIDSFEDAAELSDHTHMAHYYLGLEMIALGRFKDGLKNLDISLSRNPDFTNALFWRCFVLIILDKDYTVLGQI